MRLTWKDAEATVVVGGAVLFYALWTTDTVAVGMSVRVAAAIVFALGWLGCVSDTERMKEVYGAEGETRLPLAYVVPTSLLGGVALVAGLVAIVAASETALLWTVVTMVVLWLLTTIRHAVGGPVRRRGRRFAPPPVIPAPRPSMPAWRR